MKKQKNHSPAVPKVRMIETPSERRANRQMARALHSPNSIEDWDDLDYGFKEYKAKKVPLK